MLHESAVSPALLSLLREGRINPSSKGFALAGGTSLALRLGHRLSTDLDWFTVEPFDPGELAAYWGMGPESILAISPGTLRLNLEGIKVEFLRHAYPLIAPVEFLEGIPMWSIPDVAAMKINAINNRGSKKDFFDLAELMRHFDLREILGFYQTKYRPTSLLMSIRSLVWFEDAEAEPDPIHLRQQPWDGIKDQIRGAVRSLE